MLCPHRVDKPSHSVSVLRASAHECQIRSAPVLVLPRLQRFSITLKRRQRAKITFILALCQQSEDRADALSFSIKMILYLGCACAGSNKGYRLRRA